MKTPASLFRLLGCLLLLQRLTFGQSAPLSAPSPLLDIMTELQAKARKEAAANPTLFKKTAAQLADQRREAIIRATTSSAASDRRLSAMLLAYSSPSSEVTQRLVVLADDPTPDVRYAAIVGLATVTDGTDKSANDAIIKALDESGNSGLTRDAAFAASTLKLADGLPLLRRLLEGDDNLNRRYAAEAAARYGPMAAILLPALKQGVAKTKDQELKALMEQALASIDRPAETKVVPATGNQPTTTTPGSGVASSQTKPDPLAAAAKTQSKNENSWPSVVTLGLIIVIGLAALVSWLLFRKHKQ